MILAFSKQIATFAEIQYADVPFLVLGFIGIALKTFVCNLFMAINQRLRNAIAEFIFGLSAVSLIFLFYFIDLINLRTVFLVYLISSMVVLLVFVKTFDYKVFLPLKFSSKFILEMMHFSKWPFFGLFAIYLIIWGYNLILRFYKVELADIGDCNVAFQFFKGVVMFASIGGGYFLPFISQNINNKAKIEDFLKRKRMKILFLGIILIAILAVLVPKIISYLYGVKYPHAGLLFVLLLMASICYLYNILIA